MSDLSFTAEYYPELESLTETQLSEARSFVISSLRSKFKDVDLAAGSVTGDLVVEPLATFLAAATEAHRRLLSDLDLSNVAAGVIYSCDFVERYLGNFGVYDIDNLKTVGLVRLTFSDPGPRSLNRSMRFRFGVDEFSLYFHADWEDDFLILAPGDEPEDSTNKGTLIQTSASTWAVDIPLTGAMTVPVLRGAQGLTNVVTPGLIAIQAATNFIPSNDTNSLPELARRARLLSTSISVNSKTGTVALVRKNWPNARHVCPIITGDPEMLRAFVNSPGAFQQPAMDLYVRSSRDMVKESQIVYVKRVGSTAIMRGEFKALGRPSVVDRVYWSAASIPVENWTLYTKSSRPELLGQTHCGSLHEQFWFEAELPLDVLDTPLVPLNADGTTPLEVDYYLDPLLKPIALTLEAPVNKQPGLDLVVKAGPLANLSKLTIAYRRQAGVRMLLTDARSKIEEYVRATGWPEPYNELKIHTIMRNAGAADVLALTYEGEISFTPATRQLHALYTVDLEDELTWEDDTISYAVPTRNIATVGLRPNVIQSEVTDDPTPQILMNAATERIIRPFVLDVDIEFQEVY